MKEKINHLIQFLKQADLKKEALLLQGILDGNGRNIILLDKTASFSDGLAYHLENDIPLTDPVFREFSESHFYLINEAREMVEQGKLIVDKSSHEILDSDFGKFAEYEGQLVPLDCPIALENEDEMLKIAAEYKGKNVSINKPRYIRKGEPGYGKKKSVVYVKDGDRVKRITFGDPNLKTRAGNAKARKSFRARHNCKAKKDKTTAGYWACRFPPNW